MSDAGSGAPAPAASAPEASTAPVQENSAPQGEDAELEALEASEAQPSSKTEQPAKAAPAQAKAADKAAKQEGAKKVDADTYAIKVDGEVLELSKEEMVKYAQMGKAGQKKMQEAAQIRQEAQDLIEMLRSDPRRVLSDPAILGGDEQLLAFAQKVLSDRLEEEGKDPTVREKEKLQKELEELRNEKKTAEEKRKADEYERLIKHEEAQLEEQIQSAFETSGLPKSPFVLKRLADVMISAAENSKDISAKQALAIVKREMAKDMKEFFEMSPEDALEEMISGDKIKNLRKRQLSKLKAAAEAAAPAPTQTKEASRPTESKAQGPVKKKTMRDWLRE